jgi:hypothetical protein
MIPISLESIKVACTLCIDDGRYVNCREDCPAYTGSDCVLGNITDKEPVDYDDDSATFEDCVTTAVDFYKEYLDPMELLIHEVEELDNDEMP